MKLTTLQDILPLVNDLKAKDKVIVLATGVFDIIHQEHINFLDLAKKSGDTLLVGLETDARVKLIKGEDRPINKQTTRLENIRKIKAVDKAFLLPNKFSQQQNWENFIKLLRPDIYAVSSHTQWLENKRKIMKKFGGELKVVHQQNILISTTKIINQ